MSGERTSESRGRFRLPSHKRKAITTLLLATMGVPAFFRWISRKYPKIISPVVEETGDAQYGREPQYLDPNPNGELDNLYLDMNGIVHPCSHPEHKPAPETEDEMFLDVFKYTERVLMMARPRKVMMIAVDGVAPRAKMNQQRARRFRAAQDAKVANEEKARQIQEFELRGQVIDDAVKGKKSWDTNAITPGTPFMDGLALALRYWVAYKLATDPGWKDLQVIISDATVPGEGEHKLMSFIRSQRSDPQYDPNTRHCIYGLDADLIFLGLATHEPHFRVLREDVFAQGGNGRMRVAQQLLITQEQKDAIAAQDARKPFLWLHVNVLREYLEVELQMRMLMQWDLERAIDDWVFMCFFVGNDFLPHFPSLSVRDNGIDILVGCWKQVVSRLRDYITCDGKLNYEGVEQLLGVLATKEDEIFKKRHEQERRYANNDKRRRVGQAEDKALRKQYLPNVSKGKEKAPVTADTNMPLMDTSGKLVEGYAQLSNKDIVHNRDVITKANMANADAAAALKKLLAQKSGLATETLESALRDSNETPPAEPLQLAETTQSVETVQAVEAKAVKRGSSEVASVDSDDDNDDKVRNWEAGYRDRYYKNKFGVTTPEEINEIRKQVVRSYLEGISWVLLYYYQGCPSWQWYFPFHYAPFAADFTDLREIVGEEGIKFELGEPFNPYEQLMAVLPAASGHTLPVVFRELMSHPDSPIIDFYPENFKIDMNGAKMSWQGIALLPFIDEKRLLTEVRAKYSLLTHAERDRNTNKKAQLFISSENKNYKKFVAALENDEEVEFASHKTGLAGKVRPLKSFSPEGELLFPLKEGDLPHIKNSAYFQAWYDFPKTCPGKSMLLNGFISHDKILNEQDKFTVLGRGRPNYNFQNVSNYINNGPSGTKDFLTFSMRRSGYRALIEMGPEASRGSRPHGNNQFNNQHGNGRGGRRDHNSHGNDSHYNRGNQHNQGNRYGTNQHGNGNQYNNQSNQYGNKQYGNQGYGNQGYGNQGNQYGNQGYGNQVNQYGNNYGNHETRHNNNQYGNNQYGNNQYGDNQYGNSQYGNSQYGHLRSSSGYSRR